MRGDLPNIPQSHPDRVRYMVYVLYLSGFTIAGLASRVGLRTKQAAGIIAKSEFTNRAAMTIEERDRFLLELREIRRGDDGKLIDDGTLADAAFKARPLKGRQNGR